MCDEMGSRSLQETKRRIKKVKYTDGSLEGRLMTTGRRWWFLGNIVSIEGVIVDPETLKPLPGRSKYPRVI